MIKQTTWRPDTCACKITYSWDTDSMPETRVHTLVSIEKCGAHTILGNQQAYDKVKEETATKSNALRIAKREHPDKDPSFDLDEDRKVLAHIDLTVPEKENLQTKFNDEIGPNKAIVI